MMKKNMQESRKSVARPTKSGKYANIDTGVFLRYRGGEGKLTIMEL